LSIKKAVYQEQIGSDDQATSEAGRARRDARSEPIRKAKRDIKMRQHLMERFLCRGTWYGLTGTNGEGFGEWDTGIPDFCRPEHPSVVEVRISSQDKSIGHDGADQRLFQRL